VTVMEWYHIKYRLERIWIRHKYQLYHFGRRIWMCPRGKHLWTHDEAGTVYCVDCEKLRKEV